jgi:hypothetical protein
LRSHVALVLSLALFVPWAASYGDPRNDYRLRLLHPSDGRGNSVYALEIAAQGPAICDAAGTPAANYLFVNRKTGQRRWLFPQPQRCIWRVFYFADRPQSSPVEPASARVVVYDVTPSGDLNNWDRDGFRFCMGTNPCLPLRRIFVARADGRDLMPLTPTFQILDPALGPPSITQRRDGAIEVTFKEYPLGRGAEFSVDKFEVSRTWLPYRQ